MQDVTATVILAPCSEVARLEAAAARQAQDAAARATDRERQLHAARTASAAAEQRSAMAQAGQQVRCCAHASPLSSMGLPLMQWCTRWWGGTRAAGAVSARQSCFLNGDHPQVQGCTNQCGCAQASDFVFGMN
jgi:hypothetical protein